MRSDNNKIDFHGWGNTNDKNLYTSLYVYIAYRINMSGRLYWRYKKEGNWTWRPVTPKVLDMLMCGADIETAWKEEEE